MWCDKCKQHHAGACPKSNHGDPFLHEFSRPQIDLTPKHCTCRDEYDWEPWAPARSGSYKKFGRVVWLDPKCPIHGRG